MSLNVEIFLAILTQSFRLTVTSPSVTNPCQPSPCGPNSICRENNGQAVCTCLPEYLGSPPGCRPECAVSAECPSDRVCVNQKCTDPCPDPCGRNAVCRVINHSPICSCQQGFTGDAFTICFSAPRSYFTRDLFEAWNPNTLYYSLNSKFCRSSTRVYETCGTRSLLAIALWPVLPMQKYQRKPLVLLLTLVHRCSAELQAGMHDKRRVLRCTCLHSREMLGSLPGLLWIWSQMHCP